MINTNKILNTMDYEELSHEATELVLFIENTYNHYKAMESTFRRNGNIYNVVKTASEAYCYNPEMVFDESDLLQASSYLQSLKTEYVPE